MNVWTKSYGMERWPGATDANVGSAGELFLTDDENLFYVLYPAGEWMKVES